MIKTTKDAKYLSQPVGVKTTKAPEKRPKKITPESKFKKTVNPFLAYKYNCVIFIAPPLFRSIG